LSGAGQVQSGTPQPKSQPRKELELAGQSVDTLARHLHTTGDQRLTAILCKDGAPLEECGDVSPRWEFWILDESRGAKRQSSKSENLKAATSRRTPKSRVLTLITGEA